MDSKIVKAEPGRKILKQEVFDAHTEAREILARAEAERREALEQARHQGYEDGLARWNETVAAIVAEREEYLSRCEEDVLRLAVRMARKIVGQELRTDPATIAAIVREAMRSLRREREITIQIHPDSVEEVRTRLGQIAPRRDVEVSANPGIEPGGCVIVTELGSVDATLETQLRCMERMLLEGRRKT